MSAWCKLQLVRGASVSGFDQWCHHLQLDYAPMPVHCTCGYGHHIMHSIPLFKCVMIWGHFVPMCERYERIKLALIIVIVNIQSFCYDTNSMVNVHMKNSANKYRNACACASPCAKSWVLECSSNHRNKVLWRYMHFKCNLTQLNNVKKYLDQIGQLCNIMLIHLIRCRVV